MLGLSETAVLHPHLGRHGGGPAFAEDGVEFACRSEAEPGHKWSGDSVERSGRIRIFAAEMEARPGDRIELNGNNYTIAEVKRLRGLRGVHHLEIEAKEA